MIDKLISHYKVIKKLGEGGMGVLYLAEDTELNRKAVLKFLPPDMMNDPDINLRFKREAQAAGSLSHPNIVTIYDVGVHDNKTFIAMEYVEGKNLRESIKSDELTIERITDISVQICEGLNEAHSKGITHRDIKPENILIDEKGKVKIVDFGLAKIKNITKEITKEGSTLGTIKYMSPEQIRNQKVDHRSDIWSFGVILYEMITGRYPFQGEYDASLFYSIINQAPEPLARYKADINKGFQRIIDKALDKEPETRYQHIDEVLSDIKREGKDNELSKNKVRRKTRKRIHFIVAVLLIIALSFFMAIYFFNISSKEIIPPKHTQITFNGNISMYNDWGTLILSDLSVISPDGQFIAYVLEKDNGQCIYIKDNSEDQAIEIINGLKDVYSLKWSPDGKDILGCKGDQEFIISKLGGKYQPIDIPPINCWSPDGSVIAGGWQNRREIIFTNRTTTNIDTIQLVGGFIDLLYLDWSPINNKLVFLTRNDNPLIYTLWTINPDGTQQKKILEENDRIFPPICSVKDNVIYYLKSIGQTQDLMKIEVSTDGQIIKEPEVLQTGLHAQGFSISADNKKLIYTKRYSYSNLWSLVYDEKNKNYIESKLTQGTSSFRSPRISPDKGKIIFVYKKNIFQMQLEDGKIEQLTFLDSECISPSWSPDGKEIAFTSQNHVWIIGAKGGRPKVFNNTKALGEVNWCFPSDILYDITNGRNYNILNPKTSEEKSLIKNGFVYMTNPRPSPNQKEIAILWTGVPDYGIWIISLENPDKRNLLIRGWGLISIKWSEDGNWLYVVNSDLNYLNIKKLSIDSGKLENVFTSSDLKLEDGFGVDITSDGSQIVCAAFETNSDVWMIENFDPDVE